jgi:hypothetical protein
MNAKERLLILENLSQRGRYGMGAEHVAAWEKATADFRNEKLKNPAAWAEIEAKRREERQAAAKKAKRRERRQARDRAETSRQYAELERLAIESAGGIAEWGKLTKHDRNAFRERVNASLESPLFISQCTA